LVAVAVLVVLVSAVAAAAVESENDTCTCTKISKPLPNHINRIFCHLRNATCPNREPLECTSQSDMYGCLAVTYNADG